MGALAERCILAETERIILVQQVFADQADIPPPILRTENQRAIEPDIGVRQGHGVLTVGLISINRIQRAAQRNLMIRR